MITNIKYPCFISINRILADWSSGITGKFHRIHWKWWVSWYVKMSWTRSGVLRREHAFETAWIIFLMYLSTLLMLDLGLVPRNSSDRPIGNLCWLTWNIRSGQFWGSVLLDIHKTRVVALGMFLKQGAVLLKTSEYEMASEVGILLEQGNLGWKVPDLKWISLWLASCTLNVYLRLGCSR